MDMNRDFFRAWVGDITIAVAMTAIEIGFLSLFLWLLNLLPHEISWLSNIGFFQWVVIVTSFKVITYRYNNKNNSFDTQTNNMSSNDEQLNVPMFNRVLYDEPENTVKPVRNVYNQTEADEINKNSEHSVRE